MRQAGVLAAAGLVAAPKMVDRLADDHRRARELAEAVAERWPDGGCVPERVVTNIVLFHSRAPGGPRPPALRGVLADSIAPGLIRLMTHHDVDDAGIEQAKRAVAGARTEPMGDRRAGWEARSHEGAHRHWHQRPPPRRRRPVSAGRRHRRTRLRLVVAPRGPECAGLDPMVALAWVGAHNPTLKLGTTALLPGKNPVRLAKQAASLDALSGGRLLLTLVPASRRSRALGHRSGPDSEGDAIDELLPVRVRSGRGAGQPRRPERVVRKRLPLAGPLPGAPRRVLGGMAPASLERCGRMADGWLPPCARQPRWWPVGRSSTRRPSGPGVPSVPSISG